MKPGWKTTEFWLALAAQAIGVTLASGAIENDTVMRMLGLGATLLASLGYSAARSYVKASDTGARSASLMVPPPQG